MYFCQKCGEFYIQQPVSGVCSVCRCTLVEHIPPEIPMFCVESQTLVYVPMRLVAVYLQSGEFQQVVLNDSGDNFHVVVNGEMDSIDTGKKIREKNEQLKKKVSGYKYEERNVREDVTRQYHEKIKQQS